MRVTHVSQAAILILNYRIVEDLKAERQKSVDSGVMTLRRKNQPFNSDRGYDLVTLPGGQQTVVFTLKEFRIDREGHVLKNAPTRKKKKTKSFGGSERVRRGKLNQQKQKVKSVK